MTFRQSAEAAEAEATALGALCDGGVIRLYTGAQPATVGTAVSGLLLAEATFPDPAFTGGTVDGTVHLAAQVADSSANATGLVGYGRIFKVGGTVAVCDVQAGVELLMGNYNTVAGSPVTITSISITFPTS